MNEWKLISLCIIKQKKNTLNSVIIITQMNRTF